MAAPSALSARFRLSSKLLICLTREVNVQVGRYSRFGRIFSSKMCTGYTESVHQEEEDEVEEHYSHYDQLYPGHIQTSLLQKSMLAAGSGIASLLAPWRDDLICTFGESSGYFSLQMMRTKMLKDPVGQQILEEKPRINSNTVDLDYLKSLPEGTFGKTYHNFLDKHNVHPDARRGVQFVDDAELAYVMQRYREVHDLQHTLLGMPTNWVGEVTVKVVEGLQTGLPLCVLGGIFGPLRFYYYPKHGKKYFNEYFPWAVRNGTQAKFLMNVYYEKHWEMPIEELRNELNLEPPPT